MAHEKYTGRSAGSTATFGTIVIPGWREITIEENGKPLPTPSNNNPAPVRPSFVGKFGLILGYNGLEISRDGVLLSKTGEEKEEESDRAKPSEVNSATGTRAVRASTKVNLDTPPPATTSTGEAATPATPATPSTPATEGKADEKSKKETKKKKSGLKGLFR